VADKFVSYQNAEQNPSKCDTLHVLVFGYDIEGPHYIHELSCSSNSSHFYLLPND